MQNSISLQRRMARIHIAVLKGQLNEWLLIQTCSDLSQNKYCHQSLFELANSEIPGIQSFCVPTTEVVLCSHYRNY